jgi:hypothetical protein
MLYRNCLLRHVAEGRFEGRIELKGRRRKGYNSSWITSRKLRKHEVADN